MLRLIQNASTVFRIRPPSGNNKALFSDSPSKKIKKRGNDRGVPDALPAGIGISYANLPQIAQAFSPRYLLLVFATVLGAILGADCLFPGRAICGLAREPVLCLLLLILPNLEFSGVLYLQNALCY
jgi:hypothetical protein